MPERTALDDWLRRSQELLDELEEKEENRNDD